MTPGGDSQIDAIRDSRIAAIRGRNVRRGHLGPGPGRSAPAAKACPEPVERGGWSDPAQIRVGGFFRLTREERAGIISTARFLFPALELPAHLDKRLHHTRPL
jgi:hypothetical protein